MRKTIVLACKKICDSAIQGRSPLKVIYPVLQTEPMMKSEPIRTAMDRVANSGVVLNHEIGIKKFEFSKKCGEEFHTPLLMESFVAMTPDEIEIEDKDACIVFCVDSSVTSDVFTTALIARMNNGRLCFSRIFNGVPYNSCDIGLSSSEVYELEGIERALIEGIRLGYNKFNVILTNDCKNALKMYHSKKRSRGEPSFVSNEKDLCDSRKIALEKVMFRIDELLKQYKSVKIGRILRVKTAVDELSNYGSSRSMWKLEKCAEWIRKEERRFPIHPDELGF